MRARQAGFSLMEVLIALGIVSLIASLGFSILTTTLAGRERFEVSVERTRALELARSLIKADTSQIVWRVAREPDGDVKPFVIEGGRDDPNAPLLAFSRTGWENPNALEARGGVMQVEYILDGERLIRRAYARAAPTQDTPMIERVLLDGVTSARVEFWRANAWAPSLALPINAGRTSLPDAIALELEVAGLGPVRQLFIVGIAP